MTELTVLIASALTIGLVHALAPDHYIPIAAMGRAGRWSIPKLVLITLLAGVGHIGSSVVIGAVGFALGLAVSRLEAIEGSRGQVAGLLLIGFGLAYAVWGLKRARQHHHEHRPSRADVTVWLLIAIFVLGPCEPLIPLMFAAGVQGWAAVWTVVLVFGVATIFVMLAGTMLVFAGASAARLGVFEKYSHAFAGAVIGLTGAAVMLLGI